MYIVHFTFYVSCALQKDDNINTKKSFLKRILGYILTYVNFIIRVKLFDIGINNKTKLPLQFCMNGLTIIIGQVGLV